MIREKGRFIRRNGVFQGILFRDRGFALNQSIQVACRYLGRRRTSLCLRLQRQTFSLNAVLHSLQAQIESPLRFELSLYIL